MLGYLFSGRQRNHSVARLGGGGKTVGIERHRVCHCLSGFQWRAADKACQAAPWDHLDRGPNATVVVV
ncbi:MAG: hypothetical protein AAFS03_08635, partial [Pseudomonadota bacterium]